MVGTKVDSSRGFDVPTHRLAIDGERIDRAAKRAEWAGRALEHAAEDLRAAGASDGGIDALAEMVLDQAGFVSRLARDIKSRKDDDRRS